MKTVTAIQLTQAYAKLHPEEKIDFETITAEGVADLVRIFGNWLYRYEREPEKAIATCNWMGKVTKALFHALELKQPKTKKEMIETLK